ncbi:MAG TPA: TonB-dependent receptor plug domain-containing protein [Gemmatimonadaceae bacterium]|nr:TonB-dependent receptor plug domain-containing protein [Gemmatimonadaceae bacterium]
MRLCVGRRWSYVATPVTPVALAWLVFACTPRAGIAPASSASEAITRVEITRSQALTAYDAIRILRPTMLRERGKVTMRGNDVREPLVYVDNQRMGGISYLRDIPVSEIFEIRYHTAGQAQIKWGNGHPQGVIQVVTARTAPQADPV